MRFVVALLALAAAAHAVDTSSAVVDLTMATMEDKLQNGVWLVSFIAPWCGHCKRLAPVWEDLARSLDGRANIARVDCTVEKEATSKYDIRGFPSIFLFRNKGATKIPYHGERSVPVITAFLADHHVLSEGRVELTYFDTRGRAEATRLLLHDMEVKFTDTRVPREEWPQVKRQLVAEGRSPFGQVPALSFQATHLVQSHAMLRFLGRKYGLYGSNGAEERDVDIVTDGLEDLRRRYGTLVYDKDWQSKVHEYRDVTLPMWLGHFEEWLAKHASSEEGHALFFVGNHLTWADYVAFDLLDAQARIFPTVLDSFPKLSTFHKTFAARPNIAAYLASPTRLNTPQNGVSAFFDNKANPGALKL